MKTKSNKLRVVPNAQEGVEMVTNAVSAIVENLPHYTDEKTFLIATSSQILGNIFVRWSKDITSFLLSKKAKKEAEKAYAKLYDTLKFLHQSSSLSDEDLLKTLKNLHILSFSEGTAESEEIEIYMILEVVRQLKGQELLTLFSAYNIGNNLYSKEKMAEITKDYVIPNTSARAWCRMITRACDYTTDDHVIGQQVHLETLGLISDRNLDIRFSGKKVDDYPPGKCFRLTELAIKIVELTNRGEEISK